MPHFDTTSAQLPLISMSAQSLARIYVPWSLSSVIVLTHPAPRPTTAAPLRHQVSSTARPASVHASQMAAWLSNLSYIRPYTSSN
ncbi:hypothetical protein SVAN01_00202 [Stagonosporopsis vannaccii]|nr:hypothetical protein SVAN01_00202 [Stagonosporopsis vannaccii]